MRKTLLFIAALIVTLGGYAQIYPEKYFVKFTDKNDSPYSIDNPSEYLSQRAIDRRAAQDIPIDETDLPVNPAYLQGVAATGAVLLNPTKWLNGVTIYAADPGILDAINALPYVAGVMAATGGLPEMPGTSVKPFFASEQYDLDAQPVARKGDGISSLNYGEAFNQIHQLQGDGLHDLGFQGQGMVIAVLDAGFYNANFHPAFDSLWENGQILGTWDFVEGAPISFDEHTHGTMVLSCMGGNVPGVMIGTAPKASYYLLRSEDGNTEYIIEEYNWVSAAEFADSVGADVINSSLGYNNFDDPAQNHTYEDMDGDSTPGTIGADFAASKGILVCNSLGNEGSSIWFYLTAPSDGDSVVGVGAVDAEGNYADFSSHGPSYDGRVKPNLVAQGSWSFVADPWSDGFTYGSGTSFSSPILAGALACLWQANPEQNNMSILHAAEQSASQYNFPDNQLGYGIPDLMMANSILTVIEQVDSEPFGVNLRPNPVKDVLRIETSGTGISPAKVMIRDASGRLVMDVNAETPDIVITDVRTLSPGTYALTIRINGADVSRKLIKY